MMRIFTMTAILLIGVQSSNAYADFWPSDEQISKNIETVEKQIEDAEIEADKYEGGLLLTLIKTRIAILENTKVMLEQKKSSFINAINLSYTIDGSAAQIPSESQLNNLMEDMKNLNMSIQTSELEANKYSGGLILAMLLSQIETQKLTVATLNMRLLTAKHGIPIFGLSKETIDTRPEEPTGRIVKDKDAL